MARPTRAAACLAVLALACSPEPTNDVNLLLVTFDTLRADRLGAYGNDEWDESPSPTVDALAASGTLFETTYASRGQTHPSLASIMTGKYPITTGLRENGFPLDPTHTTLLEHLSAAGWHTGVFVANMEVFHPKEGWISRGADEAADGFAGQRMVEYKEEASKQRIWDDRVEASTMSFLDRTPGEGPFAAWVHFYDVHKPYTPPLEYRDRFGLSDELPPILRAPPDKGMQGHLLEQFLANITIGGREPTEAELKRIRGLYDAGVLATDSRLARILAKLQSLGELDNTVIVFTSDHGEELYDRNRYFFHGASIHDGTVRLPLVISGPGIPSGKRVPALTQSIDIAPTVLDLLGVAPDPGHEGHSLMPLITGATTEPPAPVAFVEWQDWIYAATDGRHKLIWNPVHIWPRKMPFGAAPDPGVGYRVDCIEGYDLQADPFEADSLVADIDLAGVSLRGDGLPGPLAELAPALRAWLADETHQNPFDETALDAKDMEHLQQLGYMGAMGRSDSVKKDPCVER
jgi:arylsulfatase